MFIFELQRAIKVQALGSERLTASTLHPCPSHSTNVPYRQEGCRSVIFLGSVIFLEDRLQALVMGPWGTTMLFPSKVT